MTGYVGPGVHPTISWHWKTWRSSPCLQIPSSAMSTQVFWQKKDETQQWGSWIRTDEHRIEAQCRLKLGKLVLMFFRSQHKWTSFAVLFVMSIHEQWMIIFPTKWRAKGRNWPARHPDMPSEWGKFLPVQNEHSFRRFPSRPKWRCENVAPKTRPNLVLETYVMDLVIQRLKASHSFLGKKWNSIYPGIPTTIKTMGVNNHHCVPKGFNHRNWVNHYFNGGGSPGSTNTFFP